MSYDLSVCVFIKDAFKGAFCLFESIAQLIPLADEFIVMDLGSTDGTLETLEEIESANSKVRIVHNTFYKNDASVFAELANELVGQCQGKRILYYQSDEIWHERLIELTKEALKTDLENFSFWRYQLKYNFQKIKWFPHPVHRIGTKDTLIYTGDGMNTQSTFSTKMVSKFDFSHFMQWSDRYRHDPTKLPTDEMILDVSLIGGFLENVPDRRMMHLPFWGEDMNNPKMPIDTDISEGQVELSKWIELMRTREEWHKKTTHWDIPDIMRYHVGKQRYKLRPELLEQLKEDEGWR